MWGKQQPRATVEGVGGWSSPAPCAEYPRFFWGVDSWNGHGNADKYESNMEMIDLSQIPMDLFGI